MRIFVLALLVACSGGKATTSTTTPTSPTPAPTPAPAPAKADHGNASVITLVVTMTFKPEHEEEFLALARASIEKTHQEPGNLLYVLTKHPSEPHTYVWIERYRDEAALGAHMGSEYIKEAMTKIPPWFAKPPQLLKLTQLHPQ